MGQIRKCFNTYYIRYYRSGRRYEESTHSSFKKDAIDLLRLREGDIAKGVPVTPKIGQLRFEEAAADLVTDYRLNGKRSLDEIERRIRLYLEPFFGRRRMVNIATDDVRAYVASRQAQGAAERNDQPGAGRAQAHVLVSRAGKQGAPPSLYPHAAGEQHPHGLLRAWRVRGSSCRAARRAAWCGDVCLLHGLARAERGLEAPVATRRPQGRDRQARTRHDEERRRANPSRTPISYRSCATRSTASGRPMKHSVRAACSARGCFLACVGPTRAHRSSRFARRGSGRARRLAVPNVSRMTFAELPCETWCAPVFQSASPCS